MSEINIKFQDLIILALIRSTLNIEFSPLIKKRYDLASSFAKIDNNFASYFFNAEAKQLL